MQKSILFFILISVSQIVFGQGGLQQVKGKIIDKQSEIPLIGATIQLINDAEPIATVTDIDGHFALPNIPIGRQVFLVSYLGYEQLLVPNIEVTAGKEVFLNISMEETLVNLNEVVISGASNKDNSINKMATISARQFSMEEVNRFSGGRSDVGRLASNFAGVSAQDDSRNDIVIRGNSPTGLLWRLEGIPIPSPNHFSTVGTTGGPVSALNTNFLKNSDFLTSAFPAEYGNALSGVFDLGFRNGNKDKLEFMFQLGAITGLEALVEGPISRKNNSSFIIGYRYSFLGISQSLGLDIGTNAVPNYSDLSFKIDMGKSKLGNFSIFGISGTSDIEFLKDEVDESDLFSADDEDARAESKFGVLGLKHNILLNDNAYIRTVAAISGNGVEFGRDRFYNLGTPEEIKRPFVIADDSQIILSLSSYYNEKVNSKLSYKIGGLIERTKVNLDQQSAENGTDADQDGIFDLVSIYQFNESTSRIEPYMQFQYKLNSKWTLNAGLHGLYYDLNQDFALEPRLAVNFKASPRHRFNIGYGLHSQSQPLPMQLATKVEDDVILNLNKDLTFTKSNHFVLGHEFTINDSWRSKIEVYYQAINDVPIDKTASTFSMLNVGADFGFPIDKNELVNGGTGNNMGIEFTLEKLFSNGYYFLGTGSIFDSKYKASDGITRNTAFNNQYVCNLLVGKELDWGKQKQHKFTIDTKLTTAGGRYFTPVDLAASQVNEIVEYDYSKAFAEQNPNYIRWDIKFGVKFNNTKRKFSHAFYFDIQNVTDNENIFRSTYNRNTNEINDVYQIGFFPNFMFKVEF